ncbi:MAG: HAD-IC family P-type ATPase [Clostridia bacterium]|nr:HAD-IC family P-type ATPase [Clostridia bacterium]
MKKNHQKDGYEVIDSTIDEYISPHMPLTDKKDKKSKTVVQVPQNERFKPDIKNGLNNEQVALRVSQNQINAKSRQMSRSSAKIIASNLLTFFNLLCVFCVIALIAVGEPFGANYFFVIIYAANLFISIFQEIKAKKAIEKLSILNEPTAKLLRNGKLVEKSVTDIVLDDIVSFSAGNQISIDGTVIEGMIEVNESMLTGESVPIKKQVGDKIMSGSFVVSGSALAVTDCVGEERYIQKLSAKAKKFKKPKSEIMTTLRWIIRVIGVLIIPISIGCFLTNLQHVLGNPTKIIKVDGKDVEVILAIGKTLTSDGIREVVTKSASVIIGMIPAGMFLLTTLALAVGVIRLANRNTSVQDMFSLEMLARVDVLCLDKTGTITDGKMKVSNCVLFNGKYHHSVNDIVSSMQHALNDNNQTAQALRNYFGSSCKLIASKIISFSSDRKYSAVSFVHNNKSEGTFAIGAPEFILSKRNLTDGLLSQINHYTSLGQRVLLLAHSSKDISNEKIPGDMQPFALITLSDNIRREAIKTIDWFKKNDVTVKVISGDNPITVSEVARRAGIEGADKYVSLDGMSDEEVISIANKYNVFGRVSPEQKAILVQAMKSSGHTVAMTGDGVNDILAMKEADCSITVATGSDATKSISHIVLMDNNFDSIPAVVGEGRRVINNIQKSSALFLMKTLFTTAFAIISILRQELFPFTSSMLTMLELMVIGIGSFALSMESNRNKVSGKFIGYIFSHSIPGACILIMNILVYELCAKHVSTPVLNADMKSAYMVAAITLGGLAYMHIICQPYNLYRTVVVVSLTLTICLLLVFGMGFFSLTNLLTDFKVLWPYMVMLFALIQFDITLGKILTKFIEFINSKLGKKPEANQ